MIQELMKIKRKRGYHLRSRNSFKTWKNDSDKTSRDGDFAHIPENGKRR
jgi:hypothetical protein